MSINKQNKAYRRGAVLGLTLAEIMLLVVFLLLLIFSVALRKEHELREKSEKALSLVSKNDTNYKKIIKIVSQQEPDMADELVEAVEGLPYISQLIKKEDLKISKDESTSQVIERGLEMLKDAKKAKDESSPVDIEGQLQNAISEKEQLKRELSDQKNQNLNMIRRLNKDGTGFGLPPCWADSHGRPEYIFNVDLYSTGIVIHDNKLPNRVDDQSKLPITMISYDTELSIPEFQKQTSPLFNWSESHQCRFYVRIHDRTENNEKLLFKKLLRYVEDHFYKYLYTR